MRIPFGTQSYRLADAVTLAAQRMVNCYLEAAPPGSESPFYVRFCHGIKSWTTAGNGPLRGGFIRNNTLFVVSGTKAYRVSSGGTATELGTIPGGGFVDMAGDETNVLFIADEDGYYWNGSTLAKITDPDWPGAAWCEYLDGYFIIGPPDSGSFYVTANRNPADINALDFISAEKYPDDIVTGIVDHGELIVFGRESFEVFYNSGNADFPLDRVPSGHGEVGCASRHGPAKLDNSVFFPGHDGVVYRLNGYVPERISTHAVEQAIQKAADRDFRGMAWTEGGHKFYALTCEDFCFVYDVTTQMWHERESYGQSEWRPLFILRAYDKWIVGDSTSNKLGELDAETFTEWGDVLRASCTSPPITADNKRVIHSRLELIFETGVGTATGQGSDPQVMLRFSDDRGRTWSSEYWRSLGRQGEYTTRVVFHRLGQSRGRIYEWAISDPVPRTLIAATTEAVSGGY